MSPCLLVCGSVLPLAGCNVVGAIAAKVGPEPTIKAQFAPAKEPTLILVENYRNPSSLRLESDAIVRNLVDEFRVHDVAPVIDPLAAEDLRRHQGPAYRKMPLDAIGQAVGAAQIVYVDLERFEVDKAMASEMLGGLAEARVRIVDVDDGSVLWPLDSSGGYPVSVKIDPQAARARGGELAVRSDLHAELADKVAKLFYDWKGESSDGQAERF